MADRRTLEQDIDEFLGAVAAEASPREIAWPSTHEPVQAFEDLRDLPEDPEDPDEEGSESGGDAEDDEDDE